MAYFFQEPALLWLAAAAGAMPIIAHLVARTRPPEFRLPTVEFLRRAMRRVWRFRRPQDWILLVLRTLALVILALAFARPLQLAGGGWGGGADEKHLVLVVDRSASMAGGAGAQSRFSLAKARALEALRGAGRLASVNLIWIDASPDAVHPDMGVATGPVEEALRHAEVGGEAGSGPAALALAIERLSGAVGTREMVVVSDFQKGSWSDPLPPFPESIRLVLVPVGAPGGNCSLAALECSTNRPLPGEPVEVIARVMNHDAGHRHVRVAFTLGTQRQTREVEIEGRGEAQVAMPFALPEKETGEIVLRAALEGETDAIPGDDVRWAMLQPREPLAVALALPSDSVGESERELWSRLLRSIPWTREAVAGEPAEIMIAAGPYEGFREAAETILSRRGGVIFRPTARAGLPTDWAGSPGGGTGAWETADRDSAGWSLRVGAGDDPWLSLFASGEYGNPVAGTASERWRLDPAEESPEGWATPIRYDDGVAAVRRRSLGGGTLWWWNLPTDPGRSTWVLQPAFLPLVGEALLLSRTERPDPGHWYAVPGGGARWEPGRFFEGGEVVLLDAADATVPIAEDTAAVGLSWRTGVPLAPGHYRWASRDGELHRDTILAHTVVNFPESEMDDERKDPAALSAAVADSARVSTMAKPDWATIRDGRPLWPWFVGAALALFALEALLLMRKLPRFSGDSAPPSSAREPST